MKSVTDIVAAIDGIKESICGSGAAANGAKTPNAMSKAAAVISAAQRCLEVGGRFRSQLSVLSIPSRADIIVVPQVFR
jgi:hypothetical protein